MSMLAGRAGANEDLVDSVIACCRDPRQLTRLAEHLEQLAPFLSRADSRLLAMERAAKLRAETALIQAARHLDSSVRAAERRPWT